MSTITMPVSVPEEVENITIEVLSGEAQRQRVVLFSSHTELIEHDIAGITVNIDPTSRFGGVTGAFDTLVIGVVDDTMLISVVPTQTTNLVGIVHTCARHTGRTDLSGPSFTESIPSLGDDDTGLADVVLLTDRRPSGAAISLQMEHSARLAAHDQNDPFGCGPA